jgi:hypothetical protein
MRSTRPSLSIAFRSFWLMALISEGFVASSWMGPCTRLLSSSPNWGRELSFREAVLPLMYRVREDGLQTAHTFATTPTPGTRIRRMPGKVPACRRAVYIGDNSNLLLELADPTRALYMDGQ